MTEKSTTQFTEAELTNFDQQPALHMHWQTDPAGDQGRWVWDTDAQLKQDAQAAIRKDFDLQELEGQAVRAMREILLAEMPRFLNLPTASAARLRALDAQIKARREAP